MSLLPFLCYVDVMFDSYMANRANDGSIDRCNLLYLSWVGKRVPELGISTLGMNHFILYVSCVDEIFSDHVVTT